MFDTSGNRVERDVFDTLLRPRDRGDQDRPRLGDGCPAARQQRPPGDGDGPRSSRPRALQPGHAPPPGRPGVARPRPLRALQRPRIDPPVLDALPVRLRPRARRPHGVPLVRIADPRPSRGGPHAGHRGHHRTARPGLRQLRGDGRRRAGAARALRCRPRRPPHVGDCRRRLLHGRRQPRSRVARRTPRPRSAERRVRRQPDHDRRSDPARHDRRGRPAVRGLRLARRVPRRDRRRLRCPRGGAARRQGGGGPTEPADPALPRRHAVAEVDRPSRGPRQPVHRRGRHGDEGGPGHPRRAVLDPARCRRRLSRELAAERCAADYERWQKSLEAIEPDERVGVGRRLGRHRDGGLGIDAADASSAARRSRPVRRSARSSPRASTRSPGSCPAPPTSPATPGRSCPTRCNRPPRRPAADSSTTASASTRWARRWSGWPATAESSRSAGRSSCSSTTCDRRYAWPRCRGRRSCSCSPTTPSGSARTGRPISPSSTSPRCGRFPTSR